MIEYYDIFEKMNEENQNQNPENAASAVAPVENTPAPAPETAPESAPAQSPAQSAPVEAAAAQSEPVAETTTETPASAPAPAPAPTPTPTPSFNPTEWDGQKKQIEKTFVKAFSPRLFRYPFSLEIDVLRGIKAAAARSVEVVEPKQVMDTGGLFWSSVLLEVTGDIKEGDSGIVKLSGEYYCHVVKRNFMGMPAEVLDVQKELNGVPKEMYFWHATYPNYTGGEAKTVIIASTEVTPLPAKPAPAAQQAATPAATPNTPAAPAQPAATTEPAPAQIPEAQPVAPAAPETPAAPAAPSQPEQQNPPQA